MTQPKMTSGFGQFHTNEADPNNPAKRLRPYKSVTLDEIRSMVDAPQKVDKKEAQWVIPSSLPSRNFRTQEREGSFHMLWSDLDHSEDDPFKPLSLDMVAGVMEFGIFDECQYEAYTSRSATIDRQKARILVPLAQPLAGSDWVLCQQIFREKLAANEITGDDAAEGAAQLAYLPNRGDFYANISNRDGELFDPITAWAAELAAKRQEAADAAAEVTRRREEAKARREALRASDTTRSSVIDAFNQAYSVEDILIQAGYDQRGDTFSHPNSESGSYSASVRDGRVHSMSSSDPLYTGGGGVGSHDAFSAFAVLFNHGDQKKAVNDAGDNWLTINGEPWNRVHRREYMREKERREAMAMMVPIEGFTEEPVHSAGAASDQEEEHPLARYINMAPISTEELNAARLTPRCVLPEFLYADVRTRISAGGTGKTTVALFEAATLALGRDLWGRSPGRQCRTVIVTREDSREILTARLREIMAGMFLRKDEIETVINNVLIIDVSGVSFRLSSVEDDVVVPHSKNLMYLIKQLKEWGADWIIFDPLVSFGVGESRVNDAEQGLIEAFRIMRNHLDCCIEGIHHSGKANAREKNLDQYAGRGGSALSDGSRMVVVMQPLTPQEWLSETGNRLGVDESGIVMALSKLSYAKTQDSIFIKRKGYAFSMETVIKRSPEQRYKSIEEQVCQFIKHEYSQGRRYSSADLDNSTEKMNLSRKEIRSALAALKVSGRIIYNQVKGITGSHFEPVTLADDGGDTSVDLAIGVEF